MDRDTTGRRGRRIPEVELKAYSDILNEAVLVDTWRFQNPDRKEFTFRRGDDPATPSQQSRIDVVLQDPLTAREALPVLLLPFTAFAPDHRPIRVTLDHYIEQQPTSTSVGRRAAAAKVNQKAFKNEKKQCHYRRATERHLPRESGDWCQLQTALKSAVQVKGSVGYTQMGRRQNEDSPTVVLLGESLAVVRQVLINRHNQSWRAPTEEMLKAELVTGIKCTGASE
jgi:hypothetical protein